MRHVAVIGSGPAGYYTAEACQKQFGDEVRVDIMTRELFDKIAKDALAGMWSKARYDELSNQYRALPNDLKKLYQDGREHLEELFDQLGISALRGIFNAAGFTDDAMIRRFYEDKQTNADVKAIGDLAAIIDDLPEFKKLGGAYFPLTRRGNFVVRGTVDFEKPTKAVHQVDEVTFDFKDRDEAIAFAKKQTSRPSIKAIHEIGRAHV